MGETIRCLMVAVAALISIIGIAPARLNAQGPSGVFEIPKSLSGGFGSSAESQAESSRNAGRTGSATMGLPNFTNGFDAQRVGPRVGGPTTAPTTSRDSAWLTETATSAGSRPTTEPMGSTAFGGQSAPTLQNQTQRNDLLSSQNRGAIATVGATQDPQSREAQLMAIARDNAANSSSVGGNSSRGFGSLPAGVQLPNQTGAPNATATYGSEFARGAAGPSSNAPVRPIYGPPTAQEANYDLSVFNAKNSNTSNVAAAQNFGQSPARATAQQDLLLPGGFTSGAMSGQATASGSALGMPAADPRTVDPRTVTPTLPSNWTYDQIAQLGRLFGVQPTDPRMGDKAFVNDLYVSYREYQAKQQAAQAAQAAQATTNPMANTAANTAATTGRWPVGTVGSGGQGQFNLPQMQTPTNPSQPNVPARDPRYADLSGMGAVGTATDPWAAQPNPARGPDVDPRLSQKDIDGLPPGAWSYDKYGNPIDKDRYIVDRFGQRVDDETQWELTIGRKRRLEEERLAKLAAERERATLPGDAYSGQGSPSDRLTAGERPGGQGSAPLAGAGNGVTAQANRPPLTGLGANDSLAQGNRIPPADQAGIGGAAGAIGRSNPYVNVFLLCSLVANAFLFISLHRLWYHHRDLIASSRMAASGMSGND